MEPLTEKAQRTPLIVLQDGDGVARKQSGDTCARAVRPYHRYGCESRKPLIYTALAAEWATGQLLPTSHSTFSEFAQQLWANSKKVG